MTQLPNTVSHHATVTHERREMQKGRKSCVLWVAGLSGAGKSTLAHAVEEQLHQRGCRTSLPYDNLCNSKRFVLNRLNSITENFLK